MKMLINMKTLFSHSEAAFLCQRDTTAHPALSKLYRWENELQRMNFFAGIKPDPACSEMKEVALSKIKHFI